jgi:hypothetical protein
MAALKRFQKRILKTNGQEEGASRNVEHGD